jgi:hypothetical protein
MDHPEDINDIDAIITICIGRFHMNRLRASLIQVVNQISDINDVDVSIIINVTARKFTGVPDSVAVSVSLVFVGNKGTVVTRVPVTVSIGVHLIGVGRIGAVITDVADVVKVSVLLSLVIHIRAVIAGISMTIGI